VKIRISTARALKYDGKKFRVYVADCDTGPPDTYKKTQIDVRAALSFAQHLIPDVQPFEVQKTEYYSLGAVHNCDGGEHAWQCAVDGEEFWAVGPLGKIVGLEKDVTRLEKKIYRSPQLAYDSLIRFTQRILDLLPPIRLGHLLDDGVCVCSEHPGAELVCAWGDGVAVIMCLGKPKGRQAR
jgi:hypothetical protein